MIFDINFLPFFGKIYCLDRIRILINKPYEIENKISRLVLRVYLKTGSKILNAKLLQIMTVIIFEYVD